MKTIFTFLISFCFVGLSFGQPNFGDLRSAGDGDWTTIAWKSWYGAWYNIGARPDATYLDPDVTVYVVDNVMINNSLTLTPKIVVDSLGSLTISATGALIIRDDGKLEVRDGTFINSSGDDGLVIKSSSSGTGSFICDQSGVSGTFEQYFDHSRWYLVSTPLESGGFDTYDFWDGTNQAYMRPYVSPGGGWGAYYGDPAVDLNVGEGYEYWQQTTDITVSTTGTFNTGAITLALAEGGSGDEEDWNLIGNPYPCGLDWGEVADRTHVYGSSFYVYDNGSYKAHNGLSGTATDGIIPPMQGFFVMSLDGTDLSIDDDDKAHATRKIYKAASSEDYFNHFKVKCSAMEQESICVIYQTDEATNGSDLQYDAPVLFNNDPATIEVYSLAGDIKSVINIYGDYPYTTSLGFRVPDGGGEFALEPFDFRNIDDDFLVTLEDTETGDIIDFNEGASYSFNFPEGGVIEDRILLHLNSTVGVDQVNNLSYSVFSNTNKVYLRNTNSDIYDISIYTTLGQMIYSQNNLSGEQLIQLNVPSGYYLVKVASEKGLKVEKLYIDN